MDNATAFGYWRQDAPAVEISGIAQQSGCFMVKIEYGEVGVMSSAVTMNTDATCIWMTCEQSDAFVTYMGRDSDATGDNVDWSFEVGVTGNEYCFETTAQVCLTAANSTSSWCSDVTDFNGSSLSLGAQQTDSFSAENFTYTVTFSSNNASVATGDDNGLQPADSSWCQFNYDSIVYATYDNLQIVHIEQETTGTYSAICGAPHFAYDSVKTGQNSTWTTL